MNSENISNHSSAKDFGKFQFKPQPADAMTFFCSSLDSGRKIVHLRTWWPFFCFSLDSGQKNWTSADVMTLFFALYLILGGKLDICGRDDPQRTCLPFAQWKYGSPFRRVCPLAAFNHSWLIIAMGLRLRMALTMRACTRCPIPLPSKQNLNIQSKNSRSGTV